MCQHEKSLLLSPSFSPAPAPLVVPPKLPEIRETGSRRRRLWDLPIKCHCPLIGVCLPLADLRRLIGKVLKGEPVADDFELHVGVVNECATRNRASEALQRDLDRRYALEVRSFAALKTTDALQARWQQALRSADVAGALWAAWTHPRCDEVLEQRICADIHMLQHQVGAGERADRQALRALREENVVLGRELAEVQARTTMLLSARAEECDQLRRQVAQARADAAGKDALVASLQGRLESLRDNARSSASRDALARRAREALMSQRALSARLQEVEALLERTQARMEAAESALAQTLVADHEDATALNEPVQLSARAVLCIGGRSGIVNVYRGLIERLGGRFIHHDGGLEDNPRRLDASLAAADLVICQAGCISHNAYWRVKDHCKRTGKRCVFLDNPSASSFERGVTQIVAAGDPASTATDIQESMR